MAVPWCGSRGRFCKFTARSRRSQEHENFCFLLRICTVRQKRNKMRKKKTHLNEHNVVAGWGLRWGYC